MTVPFIFISKGTTKLSQVLHFKGTTRRIPGMIQIPNTVGTLGSLPKKKWALLFGNNRVNEQMFVRELIISEFGHLSFSRSRVAQWKRAGPITQRSVDRNHALLHFFLFCPLKHFLKVASLIGFEPSNTKQTLKIFKKCVYQMPFMKHTHGLTIRTLLMVDKYINLMLCLWLLFDS